MSPRFDLANDAFKRDPRPTLKQMHTAGPVCDGRLPIFGDVLFVTTHDAVTNLLKDTTRFVVDARNVGARRVMGMPWWMPRQIRLLADNMLTNDDPIHRRLRQRVDTVFRRQNIDAYRPAIANATDTLLDQLETAPIPDLVSNFARELPLYVICDLLGLPQHHRPKLTRWMSAISTVNSPVGVFKMVPAISRLSKYLQNVFERRRADPQNDLISALVDPKNPAEQLSDDELLSMCFLLFAAGHETTTHAISGGVLALLQHPSELQKLQSDWGLIETTSDELLRFVSPVQISKPRFTANDTDFYDMPLQKKQRMVAVLAAANFDPTVFDDADTLDITRTKNRHVAFGQGPHLCLGLQLARAEIQVALRHLFERYPNLRLAIPECDLRWTRRIGLRALKTLPLDLKPAHGK